MRSASSTLAVIGTSQTTTLTPAAAASSVTSQWRKFGTSTLTTSSLSRCSISR